MRIIPRYVFSTSKPVGCGKHKNPDCLCDVRLDTNNRTRIDRTIPHPFFTLALNELGDDMVTDRNIVELCSVALGAYETFRFREDSMHVPLRGGPAEWQALPEEQAFALRDHYRVGTPWQIACLELDEQAAACVAVRKYYEQNKSWHVRVARSARGAERVALKQNIHCAHCGTLVENADSRRRMCSDGCRMAALRARRMTARKAAK